MGCTTLSKEMVGEGDDVGTWVWVNVGVNNGVDVGVGDGIQWLVKTRGGRGDVMMDW